VGGDAKLSDVQSISATPVCEDAMTRGPVIRDASSEYQRGGGVKRLTSIFLLFLCGCLAGLGARAQPIAPTDVLQTRYPALYRLYEDYQQYHPGLERYAVMQGFRFPFEKTAIEAHELIHIASYVHQGFFVDGIYYEPYLQAEAWPRLTNDEVAPTVPMSQQDNVYRLYMLKTPKNNLGNLVDEINAYGHVLPFVCENEPASAGKQVTNAIGFLRLIEHFLLYLRSRDDEQYRRLAARAESRGIFTLVVQRAWRALEGCGVAEATVPMAESLAFIAAAQRRTGGAGGN